MKSSPDQVQRQTAPSERSQRLLRLMKGVARNQASSQAGVNTKSFG